MDSLAISHVGPIGVLEGTPSNMDLLLHMVMSDPLSNELAKLVQVEPHDHGGPYWSGTRTCL